jgi:hypothetical protein
VFVVGKAEEIEEIRAAQGASPMITAAMEKLLKASDDRRHLTVLFAPNELISNFFRDGRPWSLCEPRQAREPLDWLLGDGMQAALFSVHAGDSAYAELTFVPRPGSTPGGSPVAEVRDRLQQMPEFVERYVASLNPHPSWRLVALRYPQMIRFLHTQSRCGVEGDLVVINAALPASALHNLVFASQMALTSPAGAGAAATAKGDTQPQAFQPR